MKNLPEALILIMQEASGESELKKSIIRKKVLKDSKKEGWDKALIDTLDNEWQWRICTARLSLGSLDWFGWNLRVPRNGSVPTEFPWWKGQQVEKLLILGEQGLGDEIMFVSMLNEVKANSITVECEPRLQKVFARSFPEIEFIGRKDLMDNSWAKGRSWDAQCFMGDLCAYYRRDRTCFTKEPYLVAEPDERYLGRTGVSWKGRQGGYPVNSFDGDLSLQYGESTALLETPDIDLNYDIESVFSLIAGLERVECVPTTVAHIAGALGVKCDVVLPKSGFNHGGFNPEVHNGLNWRWTIKHNGGSQSLWHPSITIHENLGQYNNVRSKH